MPGRLDMPRPTTLMSASLSMTLTSSGSSSRWMSATMAYILSLTSAPFTTTPNESMPVGTCSTETP